MTATICIADEDQQHLRQFSAMLEQPTLWTLRSAQTSKQVLQILGREAVDILVVNVRMENMGGTRLLKTIQDQHPQTTRIALTDNSSRELGLLTMNTAHQFIVQPMKPEAVVEIMQRTLALRQTLNKDNLRSTVSQMGTLPSLPAHFSQLMDELNSPEASIKKVGQLISRDMAMTTKMLQLVNSAFFGLPKHISTPEQAVNLLGLEMIKALALSIHIFTQFKGPSASPGYVQKLFDHCLRTGILAKAIASFQGLGKKEMDNAFLSGLIHDTGKLILTCQLPKEFSRITSKAIHRSRPSHTAEMEQLGATHAEIGAYLLGLWGISGDIVEIVAFHHHPQKSPHSSFSALTAVHAANALDHIIHHAPELAGEKEVDLNHLDQLGLADSLSEWKELAQEIQQ